MKDLFAPNRIAVLTALLGALAAAAASVLGAVDSTPKAIVVAVCVIVAGGVLAIYLLGAQKDEARKFGALKPAEQNAVAIDEAPVAAWAASPAGQAAGVPDPRALSEAEQAVVAASLTRMVEKAKADPYLVEDPPEDAA